MDENVIQVVEAIQDIQEDSTIPKNIRTKLDFIIEILKNSDDLQMKVNKALHELDDVSDDSNLQAYTRTQIWNIASLLEGI